MTVSSADIKLKFSVKTGAAGNSTAGTAAGSLGKYISTTEITDNTLHNLFDQISGEENAASDVEYRCIFIHNAHGADTLFNAKVYFSGEVAGGADGAIAVDDIAASAIGSAAAQAAEVADEDTAPAGVGAFSSPTTLANGIVVGDIAAGECRAIWVRRSASNSAAQSNDGVTLRVQGETI